MSTPLGINAPKKNWTYNGLCTMNCLPSVTRKPLIIGAILSPWAQTLTCILKKKHAAKCHAKRVTPQWHQV
jgi:hypothetical protein